MWSPFLLAFGGSLGAVFRFLFVSYSKKFNFANWPVGTFLINSLGSFFMGLIFNLKIKATILLSFGTGFLGGFTTFSTFIYEAMLLFEEGFTKKALTYLVFSVATGFISFYFGWLIAS